MAASCEGNRDLEAISRWGKIRVLFILERFRGWERGQDWGDTSLVSEHGEDIAKRAIVGDEGWRDLAYAFTGKGLRSTAIEYFSPSERARTEACRADA